MDIAKTINLLIRFLRILLDYVFVDEHNRHKRLKGTTTLNTVYEAIVPPSCSLKVLHSNASLRGLSKEEN